MYKTFKVGKTLFCAEQTPAGQWNLFRMRRKRWELNTHSAESWDKLLADALTMYLEEGRQTKEINYIEFVRLGT